MGWRGSTTGHCPATAPIAHVLLRHRLLRQAEVGEATLSVEVGRQPYDLAVPDMEQVQAVASGPHAYDVQPAGRSASESPDEHGDAFVVELAVLDGFDPVVG